MKQTRIVAHTSRIVLLLALVAGLLGTQPASADGRKLNGPLATEGDVLDFAVSPDGQTVVYRAGASTGSAVELYSVPLDGGDPILLSRTLPAGSVVEPDYQNSPDSRRVVYRAPGGAPGSIALYSVTLDGLVAADTESDPGLPGVLGAPTGGRGKVSYFHIAPDSSRVVYRADSQGNGVFELYSVSISGAAAEPVKLNAALVPGGNVFHSFISPDAAWVVYLADQDTNELFELYSVPIAGPASASLKLSGAMVAGGDVSSFLLSPNGERVVYQADQQTDGVTELWSVPVAGPAADGVKLNRDLVAMGNVHSFLISADGARVVYLADQQIDDVWELYSVPLTGPAEAGIKVSGSLVRGGDVSWFTISPDGGRVIYLADQERDEVQELYRVFIAGPASAGIKLNAPLVDGGSVAAAQVSPDSGTVVYRADAQTKDEYELYSVPAAGPATAGVKLNPALPAGGAVISFQVSPDGRHVVYIADQEVDGVDALYRVPVDGPATAAVKLSSPSAAGSVWSFQIVPGGEGVVYRADLGATGVDELYTATGE